MKSKINNNYILLACLVVLMVICCLSVNRPLQFEREKAKREEVVKARLLIIRDAEEKFKLKTGGYCGNFATLIKHRYIADSIQYIPFTQKKRFHITATTTLSKSGRQIPLMECGANFGEYLDGMDANEIANLEEDANEKGEYPGLKFGDIVDNNDNAVNW